MGEIINNYGISLLCLVLVGFCLIVMYMLGLMLGILNEYFGGYSGVQGMRFYWLC